MSESKPRSWFGWVFLGPPSKQREDYQRVSSLSEELSVLHKSLERITPDAELSIRLAINNLRENNFSAQLEQQLVTVLAPYLSPTCVVALQDAGYTTLEDLREVNHWELKQIPRVGPVSASRILDARGRVFRALWQVPPEVPKPDNVTSIDAPLLSALYIRVRSRRVSGAMLADLTEAREKFETLRRSVAIGHSFFKRVFTTPRKREAVTKKAEALAHALDSLETIEKIKYARGILQDANPPETFLELVADYRSRYADYTSVLELFRHVEVSESDTRSLHGGAPSEIAARVEAHPLDTAGYDIDLRRYQEFGARYLLCQKVTILGDEMGLGKTAQAVAAITHLHNTDTAKHFLVICPASIIHNWRREISRCHGLPPRIMHGSVLFHNFRMWKKSGGIAVTSYDTYRSKVQSLCSNGPVQVALLVVDEAHYIKNRGAKRTTAVLKMIPHCKRAVFMTGTPLENRVDEFIHLIGVCNQNVAESISGLSADLLGKKRFETMIAPVYLRRNQEDVLKELPDCIEIQEWVEFSKQERARYVNTIRAFPHIMSIRKAVFRNLQPSAKLDRIKELLNNYREEANKVVVFSFFHEALNATEATLSKDAVYRIDGHIPANQRMAIIDNFSKENGFAVMLCQIDAGGVGVNLHAASVVILAEPQFKPSTEWQAIKRLHRMGQTRKVRVHRLLGRDTIDERMCELVYEKSTIFEAYARNNAIKDATAEATNTEIKKIILKKEQARLAG